MVKLTFVCSLLMLNAINACAQSFAFKINASESIYNSRYVARTRSISELGIGAEIIKVFTIQCGVGYSHDMHVLENRKNNSLIFSSLLSYRPLANKTFSPLIELKLARGLVYQKPDFPVNEYGKIIVPNQNYNIHGYFLAIPIIFSSGLGVSYRLNKFEFTISGGYQFVKIKWEPSEYNPLSTGEYKQKGFYFGVSISYRFIKSGTP